MTETVTIPLYGWILLAALLFSQGSWLFLDARKRDANPWFWGVVGLIQCPWPFIIYWIVVRKVFRKRNN